MYSEQELEQQPLIDDDQWGRLESELGLEMLRRYFDGIFCAGFFLGAEQGRSSV